VGGGLGVARRSARVLMAVGSPRTPSRLPRSTLTPLRCGYGI
jgi:hypothetical protein